MTISKRARRRLAARGDLPAVLAAEAVDAEAVRRRQEAIDNRRSRWRDHWGRPRQPPDVPSIVMSISTPYQRKYFV